MRMSQRRDAAGQRAFTLIELMIVVAIIGILAAVAVPKFAELIRKSQEGANKGNLGALRSALTIYYGDMEGQYPGGNLTSMTVGGKFIQAIPVVRASPFHDSTTRIRYIGDSGVEGLYWLDTGQWAYWNEAGSAWLDRDQGAVWIACHHTDTKGTKWTAY